MTPCGPRRRHFGCRGRSTRSRLLGLKRLVQLLGVRTTAGLAARTIKTAGIMPSLSIFGVSFFNPLGFHHQHGSFHVSLLLHRVNFRTLGSPHTNRLLTDSSCRFSESPRSAVPKWKGLLSCCIPGRFLSTDRIRDYQFLMGDSIRICVALPERTGCVQQA